MNLAHLKTGARIRIEQTVDYRDRACTTEVVGAVQAVERQPTGSWYAHGKGGRLWLWRIDLRKDDGEVTRLSLDDRTRVTVLNSGRDSSSA